jgi:hypothetical protein
MTKTELERAMRQAWWRIAHTFDCARTAPGRESTRGYLAGLDRRLSSVTLHILCSMSEEAQAEIYAASSLPEKYTLYVKGTPSEAARRVVQELIQRQLVLMRARREIYFMEGEGEWRIIPTALVDYHRFAKRAVPNSRGRADRPRPTNGPRIARPWPRQVARELRLGVAS